MLPENGVRDATRREIGKRGRWFKLRRCSICTGLIWFHPKAISEPVGAPEPRQKWLLCRRCYEMLVVEMRRTSLQSPVRLRIAMGLVAAERSPQAYGVRERQAFQREFAWFMWLLILFALFHAVIFVILLAVPR